MMPVTIEKQIMIAAKATTVWQFIGTEEGLRQWWGLDITLEAKPGGRCEERSHWQGRLCCWRGTVTTYQPPHQLSLFLRNADETAPWPAWVTISIGLTESQGQTQVTLVQQAFDPVATESVIGQVTTQPLTTATPHAIWNMWPPQTALDRSPLSHRHHSLAAPHAFTSIPSSWVVQQEDRWQDRLQALVHQVQFAETGCER